MTPTTQTIPAAGGTFTAIVTSTSGTDGTFGPESLDSFVSLVSGTGGTATTTTLTYTVAPNSGPARTSQIRIRWTNNSTLLELNQAGASAAFTLVDGQNSTSPTDTCLIRTPTTPCTLTAVGPASGGATFAWSVTYQYGTQVLHTGAGQSFTFTQTCGGPGSTTGGTDAALNVTLTVTDTNGATTVQSGTGGQPPLIIRFFTC